MSSQGGAVSNILAWCQENLSEYSDVTLNDFTESWRSGLAFLALIHKFRPDLVDYSQYSKDQPERNVKSAFDIAELELGIPRLLNVEDFLTENGNLDKLSIFTYVSQFYQCFKHSTPSGGPTIRAFIMKKYPKRFTSHKPTENESNSDLESPVSESSPGMSVCHICQQRVYILEQFLSEGHLYHRSCFRASQLRHLDRRIQTLAASSKPGGEKMEFTEDFSAYLQTRSQPGSNATSPTTSTSPSSPTKSPQSHDEELKSTNLTAPDDSIEKNQNAAVVKAEVYQNGESVEEDCGELSPKTPEEPPNPESKKELSEKDVKDQNEEVPSEEKDKDAVVCEEIEIEEKIPVIPEIEEDVDKESGEGLGDSCQRNEKDSETSPVEDSTLPSISTDTIDGDTKRNSVSPKPDDGQQTAADDVAPPISSTNAASKTSLNSIPASVHKEGISRGSLTPSTARTPSHSPSIHRMKRPAPPPPSTSHCSRSASLMVTNVTKPSCTRSASSVINRSQKDDTKVEFNYPKDLNPFGDLEEETSTSPPPVKKSENPFGEEPDVDFEYKGKNPFEDFEESPSPETKSNHGASHSPSRTSLVTSQSFNTKKRRAPPPPPVSLPAISAAQSDSASSNGATSQSQSPSTQSPQTTSPTKRPQRPSDLSTLPVRGRDSEETSRRRSLSLVSSLKNKKKPAPARPVPPKRIVQARHGITQAEIQAARHRLNTTNREQQRIEIRSKEIQESLWKADESSGEFEDLLAEWLRLVQEKGQLFREEHELMMKLEQQELEERHAELEFELRVLSSKQESLKTDADREREEELLKILVETVEARARLVENEDIEQKKPKQDSNNHSSLENKFKKMLCLKSKFHTKKKSTKSTKEPKEKHKKSLC